MTKKFKIAIAERSVTYGYGAGEIDAVLLYAIISKAIADYRVFGLTVEDDK